MDQHTKPGFVRFSVDVCPHGHKSLSVNYGNNGIRLAGPKCCGRTTEQDGWGVSTDAARRIVEEIESFAEKSDNDVEMEDD